MFYQELETGEQISIFEPVFKELKKRVNPSKSFYDRKAFRARGNWKNCKKIHKPSMGRGNSWRHNRRIILLSIREASYP